jgi:putative copper resistance protein D
MHASLVAGAFLLSLLLAFQLWLLTATMLGTSNPSVISRQLVEVLLNTHAGRVILPQFCAAILIVCASFFSAENLYFPFTASLFLLLSVFRSASGHAASDGDFSLREICQWVHLISTGVWSGGVIVASAFVFRGNDTNFPQTAGERLSKQSLIAVLLVIVSGSCNTWLGSNGAISLIPHSNWGRILVAKLVLVASTLLIGGINRQLLRKMPGTIWPGVCFTQLLRIEAVLMIATLFISGWLATMPPINE